VSTYKVAGEEDKVFDDGTSGPGAARVPEPLMTPDDFLRGAREWLARLSDEHYATLVAEETMRRIKAKEENERIERPSI
jgi:hypothetical protein